MIYLIIVIFLGELIFSIELFILKIHYFLCYKNFINSFLLIFIHQF